MFVIAAVLVVWLLIVVIRRGTDRRDLAGLIVRVSARRLDSSRPEWGRAMTAELSYLDGRPERLRFALGCARAALTAPLGGDRPPPAALAAVACAAGAVIGLSALVQRKVLDSSATGSHGAAYEIVVTLLALIVIGVHVGLVTRRTRRASADEVAARRSGIPVGIVLGATALVVSLPLSGAVFSPGGATTAANVVFFPVMIAGCLLAGALAGSSGGDGQSGLHAGVWAARVAGAIMAIGLLAATVFATSWFTHDPSVIGSYRDTWRPSEFAGYHTHFHTIAGFVFSENLDTALIAGLIVFPVLGLVFGSLGGVLGSSGRRRHATAIERPTVRADTTNRIE